MKSLFTFVKAKGFAKSEEFLKSEDGAITVDWVVLSAVIIGLGMVVLMPIAFSTENSTQVVADQIESQPVGYGNN